MKTRAQELLTRLQSRLPVPDTIYLNRLNGKGPERSLVGFLAGGTKVVLFLLGLVVVWLLYALLAPLFESAPFHELGDARIQEDYRKHRATAWEVIDDRHLVLATRTGLFHCRLDGGRSGFWETVDARGSGGAIVETDYRQLRFDGHRIWFLGARGSLSSCNRDFDDWRLHLGGGGFAPNLDLAKALTTTALQISHAGCANCTISLRGSTWRSGHDHGTD